MILALALATFLATLVGGLFALRLQDRLHLVLGFSAGAILGVAFFDLLPEALTLAEASYDASTIASIIVVGFLVYLTVDRFVLLHGHSPHDGHSHRGVAGAASLALHSFLDGIGVGLAFQVSASVGAIVAAAVLTHDFSDGINTVGLIIKNGGTRKEAFRWLLLDASAPVLGMLSTLFFSVPAETLGLLLALFCGFLLYISASDLIPESHHAHPVYWTTVSTILGVVTLYGIVQLAGI
jgi:ZIP family zinc transporter